MPSASLENGPKESKVGVKFLESYIPPEYFAAVGDQQYILEIRVDQDTPLVLCEIGKRSQTEESEFCFLQIILLSDNIYFTLRERDERVDKKGRTQPRKALGVGKIDLKKLYDQISIGTLQK